MTFDWWIDETAEGKKAYRMAQDCEISAALRAAWEAGYQEGYAEMRELCDELRNNEAENRL